MIPRLILLVGIPGSGKTSWLKKHDLIQYDIHSPDELRKVMALNVSDQTKNTEIFEEVKISCQQKPSARQGYHYRWHKRTHQV